MLYKRQIKKCKNQKYRIIGTKVHLNAGKSSHGRSQGLPQIFRAAIYRAHRAVICAIAQLSCYYLDYFGEMSTCCWKSISSREPLFFGYFLDVN